MYRKKGCIRTQTAKLIIASIGFPAVPNIFAGGAGNGHTHLSKSILECILFQNHKKITLTSTKAPKLFDAMFVCVGWLATLLECCGEWVVEIMFRDCKFSCVF